MPEQKSENDVSQPGLVLDQGHLKEELGDDVLSLRAKHDCPSDMAVIPGSSIKWVWTYSEQGEHRRVQTKLREIKPFCMDRYEYPNRIHAMPRTEVSYIEAQDLCSKEGKYLCTEFQWEFSCSGEEGRPYSYGMQKEPWRCNTDGVATGNTVLIAPAGSHPGCRNRYGVFDLNGNVSEWVAMRERGSLGVVRGGTAWPTDEYGQSCFSRHAHPVTDSQWPDDGFRCCKDAVVRSGGN